MKIRAETLMNSLSTNGLSKTYNSSSMGALLLNAGTINAHDIERIIALQKQKDMRFGEAAKVLGLVNDDDIQKVLSQQFDFPFLAASEWNFSRELVAAYNPFNKQVEELRAVRGQLMLRWFIDAHNTVALVSPRHGEGRSYITANLAIVFSQLGKRTLLIDADLRQPRQHTLFNLHGGIYGLSDILAGRADLTVIKPIPSFQDLSVLPAGTVPPNPIELIGRGLNSCVEQLKTQFDVILIDTPPSEQGIDMQTIAAICGGALLVIRQNKTRLKDLQLLKEALYEAGSECLGAVILDF